MTVPARVQRALQDLGVPDSARLLVAVSGGRDSSILLRALHAAGRRGIACVWVDHGLRSPADRAADEGVVRRAAAAMSAPLHVVRVPPGEIETQAARDGQSVEHVARTRRYRAFLEVAGTMDGEGPVYVITAHHRRDQAETVLMRLSQGRSFLEHPGMPAVRQLSAGPPSVVLVRPVLEIDPDELYRWGREVDQEWSEDVTNSDRRYVRNAIRGDVLPVLGATVAGAESHLANLAAEARDVRQALLTLIPGASRGRIVAAGECARWVVPRERLDRLPSPARELVIREAAYRLTAVQRIDGGFLREALRQLDAGTLEISVSNPGAELRIVADRRWVTLERDIVPDGQSGYLWPVYEDCDIQIAVGSREIRPVGRRGSGEHAGTSDPFRLQVSGIQFPGVLRRQRPGDRILRNRRLRPLAHPDRLREPAAVVEDTAGIAIGIWRDGRWVSRDTVRWSGGWPDDGRHNVTIRVRG